MYRSLFPVRRAVCLTAAEITVGLLHDLIPVTHGPSIVTGPYQPVDVTAAR